MNRFHSNLKNGEVHYLVALSNGEIAGAGCAILRDSSEGKYWYLCDFKIAKRHRGRGIMEQMFKEKFMPFAFKSRKLASVQMGDTKPEKNALLAKKNRMFWMFKLKVSHLNFHTWKANEVPEDLPFITTNEGKKDLVVSGENMPLFHAHPKSLPSFTQVDKAKVPAGADVMTCVLEENDTYDKKSISSKGILITFGFKKPEIFTVEI